MMPAHDRPTDGRAFGPFYPPTLQPVVDHAERLWGLVAIHELAPPSNEWASAWLHGRSEEIASVAFDVLRGWRSGEVCEAVAAASLEAYLATVHRGLAEHLGCPTPACCRPAPTATGGPTGRSRTYDATLEDAAGVGSARDPLRT
ncbi:MAG: hypothetical protein ABSE49_14465 [Polyangiaceae bacterium]|jgi:hypothetical protein